MTPPFDAEDLEIEEPIATFDPATDVAFLAMAKHSMESIHARIALEKRCAALAVDRRNDAALREAVTELVALAQRVRADFEAARLRGEC